MRSAAPVLEPEIETSASAASRTQRRDGLRPQDFRFQSLVLTDAESIAGQRSTTLAFSLILHGVLIAAVVIVPLFMSDLLPVPDTALHAFFVAPNAIAPPPPPPPPPPAGARAVTRAPAAPRPVETPTFTAPVEVPTEVKPDNTGIDLGVEGGVPGGVEGGVPGGVVGGIIGGLPQEAPPPPKMVRIGGQIIAPAVIHRVAPEYPRLAVSARLNAVIQLEAQVDVRGIVQQVTVTHGHALFDEAAIAAVKQWRYKPLLLNGTPTPFVLGVTIGFRLTQPVQISE